MEMLQQIWVQRHSKGPKQQQNLWGVNGDTPKPMGAGTPQKPCQRRCPSPFQRCPCAPPKLEGFQWGFISPLPAPNCAPQPQTAPHSQCPFPVPHGDTGTPNFQGILPRRRSSPTATQHPRTEPCLSFPTRTPGWVHPFSTEQGRKTLFRAKYFGDGPDPLLGWAERGAHPPTLPHFPPGTSWRCSGTFFLRDQQAEQAQHSTTGFSLGDFSAGG